MEREALAESVAGTAPSALGTEARYLFYKLYETGIMPAGDAVAPLTLPGIHGREHLAQVGRFALDISLFHDVNPIPALLAAAMHDRARVHNEYDEEHGPAAVPLARLLLESEPWRAWTTPREREEIYEAIRNHTVGRGAADPVSGALWDGDRIRLSWKWGYSPEYYSTKRGMELGQLPPPAQEEFEESWAPLADRLRREIAESQG